MNLKQEKGITLIALIITIIVMIIIAGIAIYSGKDTIKKANLESLKTNMLVIQAKTKTYVEEVNHKIGVKPDTVEQSKKEEIRNKIYVTNGKLEEQTTIPDGITSQFENGKFYKVTQNALENMGIGNIKIASDEEYLVEFDETNARVEVYNTKGYNGVYSLSGLENIE